MLGIYMIINNFYAFLVFSIYVIYLLELFACMYIYVLFIQTAFFFLYCLKDIVFSVKKYTYVFDGFVQFFSASKQRDFGRNFKQSGTGEKNTLDRN